MTRRRKKNKLSKGHMMSKKDVLEYQKSMRKWSSQPTWTISPGILLLAISGILLFWAYNHHTGYSDFWFDVKMVGAGIFFLLGLMYFAKDRGE